MTVHATQSHLPQPTFSFGTLNPSKNQLKTKVKKQEEASIMDASEFQHVKKSVKKTMMVEALIWKNKGTFLLYTGPRAGQFISRFNGITYLSRISTSNYRIEFVPYSECEEEFDMDVKGTVKYKVAETKFSCNVKKSIKEKTLEMNKSDDDDVFVDPVDLFKTDPSQFLVCVRDKNSKPILYGKKGELFTLKSTGVKRYLCPDQVKVKYVPLHECDVNPKLLAGVSSSKIRMSVQN